MSTGAVIAGAIGFVWVGMVLAISFLETPLKFRAPGVGLALAATMRQARSPARSWPGSSWSPSFWSGNWPSTSAPQPPF